MPLAIAQDFTDNVVNSEAPQSRAYKDTFETGNRKSLGCKTYVKLMHAAKLRIDAEREPAMPMFQ